MDLSLDDQRHGDVERSTPAMCCRVPGRSCKNIAGEPADLYGDLLGYFRAPAGSFVTSVATGTVG